MRLLVGVLLFVSGTAFAAQESTPEAQYWMNAMAMEVSHWYCISESPGNMQSSGHIGYGHGRTKEVSARRAVEACGRDGGFGCGAAQCFPE